MKISIVGPGIMPIPPTGWGAVEILIWDQKLALEELGHEVRIVNTASGIEILKEINEFRPDFVHVQYDDFVELCPYIQYPNAITSHFGYLEQPNKWDYYGPRVAQKFANIKPNIFCLSPGIRDVYEKIMEIPSNQLFVTPNGVNVDKFKYNKLTEDDPFGYVAQVSAYAAANDLDRAAFLAINKSTGEVCLSQLHSMDMINAKERIKHLKNVVADSSVPDKCYSDLPDGKSGNRKLAVGCVYCEHKRDCWSDANGGAGLRAFKYSQGRRYLTQVAKQPDVPEVSV